MVYTHLHRIAPGASFRFARGRIVYVMLKDDCYQSFLTGKIYKINGRTSGCYLISAARPFINIRIGQKFIIRNRYGGDMVCQKLTQTTYSWAQGGMKGINYSHLNSETSDWHMLRRKRHRR